MSSVEYLREFVTERLTAAAEEIFRVVEITIVEYEEELARQRRLLEVVWKPEIKLHRIELPQQHVCKEEEDLSDQELNMPVITSVVSEANRDHQLLSHNSHEAESQDQKGGKHKDSGSTRNAEPEPKKRQRKSRSHSNNVDNTNMSEVHPNTQTELPQQLVCKEEEVLSDQQLCIQEKNSSLGQEDPQIKEEQEELCTSQEGKQLVLKQETDTFRHSNNVNNTNMSEIHRNTQTNVQQLSVVKAEVPPKQQEWSSSLDQEDPEPPPHIKEEQEELWTSQEREQRQGLEEADIKFPLTSVPVKSEEDEEKAQSSQLHESQTEENREAERTEADGENRGEPEPARKSDPDSPLQPAIHDKTSDSSESETREPQSGLNPLQNNEVAVSDVECNTGNTSVSSSECAGSVGHKKHLQKHSGVQTGVKPFSCSVCGKRYLLKKTLTTHMKLHSEEKCYTCSVCKTSFCQPGNLVKHMRIHTGEKPFSCSVCGKRFTQKQHLKPHLAVHTGEKTFSCSVCSKRFTQKQHLKQHLAVHTGEKTFSCSVCSKRFALKQHLKRHLTSHTGEKLFSCSVCDKRFAHKQHLKTHLPVHTGEKPFSCSICSKRFALKQYLKRHLHVHTGEK